MFLMDFMDDFLCMLMLFFYLFALCLWIGSIGSIVYKIVFFSAPFVFNIAESYLFGFYFLIYE